MSSKKILLVFGATGAQGGSVVDAVLRDSQLSSEYTIRGITRDPSKPKGQELAKRGVEPITGDLDDKESIKKAMNGADAVFLVTDYWAHMDQDREVRQGKAVADIAKGLGVKHFIYSSLMNINKLSGGKYPNVYHFDSKATIEDYIREIGLPAAFFMPGYYMSNVAGSNINNYQGPYNFTLPVKTDTPIPLLDTVADSGKFVAGMLKNWEKVMGKGIYAATDYYTPESIIKTFQEVKPQDGQGGQALALTGEQFKGALAGAGMPDFIQQELLENMLMMQDFGYYGGADLKESQSIVSEPLTTWKEFVEKEPKWKDLK